MSADNLTALSTRAGHSLTTKQLTVSTAESCSGGLLGHVLTSVSGSSAYYIGGVIAYSNPVKESMLDVRTETLAQFGAVSQQTACEMAVGVRERLGADIGLSTTGIAGPTGGTPTKPVGLVYIGISTLEQTHAFECHFAGNREAVKESTVKEVLLKLLEVLAATD